MSQITNKDQNSGGDVVGPGSATDNAVARFDGTTGKLIKNSVVIVDNSGNMSGVAGLSAVSATLSGLTANRMVMTGAAGVLQTPTALTNGQLFIGSTGAQPSAGSITSTRGTIDVTLGAGTINLEVGGGTSGTGQTIGAVTANVITLALGAVAGTYTLEIYSSGFESATPASVGGQVIGVVRTDGASATLVGSPNKLIFEEAALVGATIDLVVSGNNAIVQVTGVALLTINWSARLVALKVV